MLKTVQIKNFRICEDVHIQDMRQVIALVGRNGAGKTNILQAIQLFCTMATAAKPIDLSAFGGFRDPNKFIGTILEFAVDIHVYCYQAEFGISMDENRPPRIVLRESLNRIVGANSEFVFERNEATVRIAGRGASLAIGNLVPALPTITSLLPSQDVVVAELRNVIGFLAKVRYYELDEPNRRASASVVLGSAYQAWVAKYETDAHPGESVLFRLIYMDEKRGSDFHALQELLGPRGLGLIDKIVIKKQALPKGQSPAGSSTSDEFVYFVQFNPSLGVDVLPIFVTADSLSVGTRRVLRMFVSLVFDDSSVILLEQPEDSLHPGLTKKVIGLLRQNAIDTQLIMSSHSSALLNKLKPEEIRLVSLHNGHTTVRQLSPKELENAARFMNDEGTLYEFLEPEDEEG